MKRKQRKRKGSVLTWIILAAAVCVLSFSAFQLYKILSSYKKGTDEYKKIQDLVINQEEEFTVDFEKLREMNPDVVAWIRFEEPEVISYPVVHSKDNQEYLTKTFGYVENSYGTLFVDMENAGDFSDKNTFIYGHRMNNGSMFGKLEEYAEKSFCEEHPYFYIYTPDGYERKYRVFSAGVVKSTSDSYKKVYNSDEEYERYIEKIRAESNYQIDISVTAQSQIVSLSTCTAAGNEDRFLIHAVRVSE